MIRGNFWASFEKRGLQSYISDTVNTAAVVLPIDSLLFS